MGPLSIVFAGWPVKKFVMPKRCFYNYSQYSKGPIVCALIVSGEFVIYEIGEMKDVYNLIAFKYY